MWIKNKRIVYTLFSLSTLVLLSFSFLLIILLFYTREIKEYFAKELSVRFNAQVTFSEIDFTFFKNFPQASISFQDLHVLTQDKKKLFNASKMYFTFSITDLLSKKYNIEKLDINKGNINLDLYKNGLTNFNFLQTSKGDTSGLKFSIQKISLTNMGFNFTHVVANQNYSVFFQDFKSFIDRGKNKIKFKIETNCLFKKTGNPGITELNGSTAEVKISGFTNEKISFWEIEEVKVNVKNPALFAKGTCFISSKKNVYSISIHGDEDNIGIFLGMFGRFLPDFIQKTDVKGILGWDMEIKNNVNPDFNPLLKFDFILKEINFKLPPLNYDFYSDEIKGHFNNGKSGKNNTSELQLEKSKIIWNTNLTELNLNIKNFDSPSIQSFIEGNISIESVPELFTRFGLDSARGKIQYFLDLQGNMDTKNLGKQFKIEKANGMINGKLMELKLKNYTNTFKDINFDVEFKDKESLLSRLYFFIGESDLKLQMTLPSLADMVNDTGFIHVNDLLLHSEKLKIEDLFFGNNSSLVKDNLVFGLYRFLPDAGINIQHLSISDKEFKNVKGNIIFNQKSLNFKEVHFNSLGGEIKLESEYNIINKGLILKLIVNGIDIKKMFETFSDSGKKTFTAKNISGKMDGSIEIFMNNDSAWMVDINTLSATADIVIRDGKLINFTPLLSLKKYINEDLLKELNFSNLRNKIFISDGKLVIPEMEINSSLTKMWLSGSHQFKDNEMEYHFKILLPKKSVRKSQEEDFGSIEDDGLGNTLLFLVLKGKGKDAKVKYDTEAASKKIKQAWEKEKEELKKLFKPNEKKDKHIENEKSIKVSEEEFEMEEK